MLSEFDCETESEFCPGLEYMSSAAGINTLSSLPWERPFEEDSAHAELLALVIHHQDDLKARLNDEEKEIFEKYADCTSEMHDIAEREAFVKESASAQVSG